MWPGVVFGCGVRILCVVLHYSIYLCCVCDEASCVHRRCCTKIVVKSWAGGMFKEGVINVT